MPRPTQQRARSRHVSIPRPPSAEGPPPRKTPTGLVALGVVVFAALSHQTLSTGLRPLPAMARFA